ncbi:hypothetical protein Tco_0251155 [Tanacetum coccineum]
MQSNNRSIHRDGEGALWCTLNETMIPPGGLNALIKEAVARDIFKGWQIGNDDVMVSLLQYIDDIVIFGEWNRVNAENLMCILKCFEEIVGLKINLNKRFPIGLNMRRASAWNRLLNGKGKSITDIFKEIQLKSFE